MKRKLFNWFLGAGILYMSHSVVYAENMNLIYDGKNHLYTGSPIQLYIDGQAIVTSVMPPIQLNYTTLVPAREVFATMGAEVEWRPSEQSVYVHNEDTLIVLTINHDEAWVNGENKKLNMPAKLINDKVMIPLRFISEALGYTVSWSKEESAVYIVTPQVDNIEDDLDNNDGEIVDSNEGNLNTDGDMTNQDNGIVDSTEEDQNIDFNTPYMFYVGQDHTLVLNGLQGLQMNQITYNEDEYTKQISINLNGNYSAYIPEGSYSFNEGDITGIDISHFTGTTQLIITTKTIKALQISEQNGMVMLKIVKPSEKYSRIVVIDAGHGAHDAGTSYGDIKEKDLNLALATELIALLQADPNIKVYGTRVDDTFVELMDRVEFSNQIDPDLFISIHINWATNPSASGTETFYTIDTSDTRNKILATMVQEALVNEFGTKNRGVKTNTFVVTRYTEAPAILIEMGFLSSEVDRAIMTSSDFNSRYAQTVYQCILDYYAQGLNY